MRTHLKIAHCILIYSCVTYFRNLIFKNLWYFRFLGHVPLFLGFSLLIVVAVVLIVERYDRTGFLQYLVGRCDIRLRSREVDKN